MREFIVKKSEEGIRLNKYIKKILPLISDNTIYKLLRKKYFKINDKVASGNELLKEQDEIKIFLGEDTFNKFIKNEKSFSNIDIKFIDNAKKRIIYEDDNIILYNKEKNMLSQSDYKENISINEILKEYVNSKCKNNFFNPTIVNRLDRNTEGIIIFAKNYIVAREISKMIRNNKLEKYYEAYVNGVLNNKKDELINYYKKDTLKNIAIIKEYGNILYKDYDVVKLKYNVIKEFENYSIIDINLITGKSHQIRAQFAYIGNPIIGDKKYMSKELYEKNVKMFGDTSQKLKCYKIIFGEFENESIKYLSHKSFMIN